MWKPELYQVIQGGLDKDVTYTLRFTAKVNVSSRAIRVVVQSNESPYSFLWSGSCGQVTLTSAVQNFVCAVTLPSATTNARLNFLLGGSGGSHTVWIDNVSLSRSN